MDVEIAVRALYMLGEAMSVRRANCFFFVGTYRPANSHDSPVSRTIFELFSRPHNKISQSHVFWGNIILI